MIITEKASAKLAAMADAQRDLSLRQPNSRGMPVVRYAVICRGRSV